MNGASWRSGSALGWSWKERASQERKTSGKLGDDVGGGDFCSQKLGENGEEKSSGISMADTSKHLVLL